MLDPSTCGSFTWNVQSSPDEDGGGGGRKMARVLHHYLAGMNIIHIDGFDTFTLEKVASFFKP